MGVKEIKDLNFEKIGNEILEKLGWEGYAKAFLFIDPNAEKGKSGYPEDKKVYRFPVAVLGENLELHYIQEAIISAKKEIQNLDLDEKIQKELEQRIQKKKKIMKILNQKKKNQKRLWQVIFLSILQ